MSSVSGGATVIVDKDGGDAVTVTASRLDVNAYLSATPTIDIGDVSLLLGGTAASVNNGAADATTLRVTIASDTTGVLSIDDNGGSLTIDGTITANLGATDNAVLDSILTNTLQSSYAVQAEDLAHSNGDKGMFILGVQNEGLTLFGGADDYCPIGVDRYGAVAVSNRYGAFAGVFKNEDTAHINADLGLMALTVRNDVPASLTTTDGDYAPLQVSAIGALYVDQIIHTAPDTFTMLDIDNAAEQLSATIGTFTDCTEIFLQTDEDNTGYVIIGDASVADNRGMKLNPGDTLILDNSDTRTVYLWGSAADQNVRCMIHVRAT